MNNIKYYLIVDQFKLLKSLNINPKLNILIYLNFKIN